MKRLPKVRVKTASTLLLAGALLVSAPAYAASSGRQTDGVRAVRSPNGAIEVEFRLERGTPVYEIRRGGETLVGRSRLGVTLADGGSFDSDLALEELARRELDETWEQPWGEKREIRSHANELRVLLRRTASPTRRMAIVFRVFDDGVGFRYEWPEQQDLDGFEITDELTEFAVADDPIAWWIPAYQGNRYEFLYTRTPLSEAPTVHTPLTLRRGDGVHLSIHEAALADYSSMTLAKTPGGALKADLVPWSDGVRVRADAPHASPWRTIQISPDAAGLIESYLVLNLNEPNALGDVSWITPGKYAGVWWEMHLATKTWGSGPQHGATTANAKKHIDFAAANGLMGVLVEGWNTGWDGDWMQQGAKFSFTQPYADFDLEEVARYARDKGVSLIGHHETAGAIDNYECQMDEAFDLYERLGVSGVKTGYVAHGTGIARLDDSGEAQGEWHHGQYMVRHYRKAIRRAAEHHLMLDVHEPIKDTGERRTFPNMMTREGARGLEYDAWSPDGGNPPEHTTILPFTRLLAGPMGYCPGVFDLLFEEARPDNRVNSTIAKQLALYVVLYSPLQMVPDLPENYATHPEALRFIRDVPTDWEDTRVLAAEIGDYVAIARQERGGKDWYLGAVTDEEARTLSVDLSFLPEGQRYVAEVYEDATEADWRTEPLAHRVRRQSVDRRTAMQLNLAAGGGVAIRFVADAPESPRQARRGGGGL